MVVTLCGLAGTGKGTSGKIIAAKLELECLSTGNMFRQMAAEMGISVKELDGRAQNDDGIIDRAFDARIQMLGETKEGFFIVSRFAWYFIKHSIKVCLTCADTTRYRRVAERDNISLEQAEEETRFRDASVIERAKKYYGIKDLLHPGNFDAVIDTGGITPTTVAEMVVEAIRQKVPLS